jgi:hypothetical protein
MSNPDLDEALAAYLARPVAGDQQPAAFALSPTLVDVLARLAADRAVPVDALVEHMLFKAVRAENARRMVDEKPDPIPSSFLDARVAAAKAEVARDVAAIKGLQEARGDRATRIVEGLESTLHDAGASLDPELEALQRRAAATDAMLDEALKKPR